LLKRVGIAAAVATAGLLALSPLAIADEDIHGEQKCSAEVSSHGPFGNFPEPLTTFLNGNIHSCKNHSFVFPPED
jgi:hypothetical protein